MCTIIIIIITTILVINFQWLELYLLFELPH